MVVPQDYCGLLFHYNVQAPDCYFATLYRHQTMVTFNELLNQHMSEGQVRGFITWVVSMAGSCSAGGTEASNWPISCFCCYHICLYVHTAAHDIVPTHAFVVQTPRLVLICDLCDCVGAVHGGSEL